MRLRDKISEDLMAAMKAKEAERLSVLRMMKAAVRNKEIDARQELDDAQAVQVLLEPDQAAQGFHRAVHQGRPSGPGRQGSRGNQGDRGVPAGSRYR